MDVLAIAVGCGSAVIGLLIIALAIPLARGRIGRNRFYGFRFPESFQSDEAWDAINRYGGMRLIVWAVALVLFGIACLFLPLHAHLGLTLLAAFAPVVFILTPALEAWRFARQYRPGNNQP